MRDIRQVKFSNIFNQIKKFKAYVVRYALGFITLFLISVAAMAILWPHVVHLIPAGHKGVLFKRLSGGTVLNYTLEEGLHLVLPWNIVTVYDTRIQQKVTTLELLTSDRLKSKVTLSFQFVVYPFNLPYLHKFIGPNYYESVVLPIIESTARTAVAKYTSAEAFTQEITNIIQTISLDTTNVILEKIAPTGLSDMRLLAINDAQVIKFSYPQDVEQAMQEKAIELAKAEGYVYRLIAARREAERKEIEAGGISQFNKIVGGALTDNYLRFLGITATEALAKSDNAKIVIFGNSPSGLPLILGGLEKSGTNAERLVSFDGQKNENTSNSPDISVVNEQPSLIDNRMGSNSNVSSLLNNSANKPVEIMTLPLK